MTIDLNFQTPIEVIKYMVSLVPPNCIDVLEPTPGIGNIVKELQASGYKVTAPEDFFLLEKANFDCVIMNPPFSSKSAFLKNAPPNFNATGMRVGYYFLTECMKKSNHIIALMPWFTISDSDVRLRYLKGFGLKSLTALPRKTFQYARIQTMIMELEKGYQGETLFKVFEFRHSEKTPQLKLEESA
jgi:type I restriction-modification system DNA methylase subunit